ncbi:M20 family metallo-hydrolase [Ferrovum sp. PN-J185]|uniref:M20 family metallo-hydrolase n=1 Tax=Ferrovum sp. PN-J185 TaxID=1356306 RepID=UPI000791CA22|nr:M20 family metallo-hydrolase [Ferrovum sp. PN-J185]KXW56922.1 allantoate amidohydrolase [Ferrovum sp. PN-J185]MCC6069205.1 M20 family metallo-hydrolase [Ferrovum sp. PN-J185]
MTIFKDLQFHRELQSQIQEKELITLINQLATFGGRNDGGVSRLALSNEDIQARSFLIEIANNNQWKVFSDEIGNLFIRIGDDNVAPVLCGSHIDTQPVGGKLDGAYGVVAAMLAGKILEKNGFTKNTPLEIVIWNNEEGCRFSPGTMGSSAFVDRSNIAKYLTSIDKDGVSLKDALLHLRKHEKLVPIRQETPIIKAYLELHIEQGPILEHEKKSLGVVTAIQAVRWFKITIEGVAAHAGTTPMHLRKDALIFAHKCFDEILRKCDKFVELGLLITSGSWHVSPNSINTIPDKVTFTIDIRSKEDDLLDQAEQIINSILKNTSEKYDFKCTLDSLFKRQVTYFPTSLIKVLNEACNSTCQINNASGVKEMVSGAFHDAMYLSDYCPAAMIFVPSIHGISHNAIEDTNPFDLTNGLKALTSALALLLLDES